MKKTGIYKITNVITGKVYIGSTTNFKNRWSSHICRLKNNTHHSIKLQNSVNKHNIENFKFEVLEECAKELLIEREQYWINEFDSFNNGYNSRPNADGRGEINEITRQKLSFVHTGKKMSEESKKKMSNSKKGRKLSEETKNKLSQINKGKKMSDSTKLKMSKSKKGLN